MEHKNIFEPISGFELPRFAGLPTFMRLPYIGLDNSKISDVDFRYQDQCKQNKHLYNNI